MLAPYCLLFCSLTHPHPLADVLFVQSTERSLGTSPRMTAQVFLHTSLLPTAFFFLLVAVLMQHLQHGIKLPWDPVQRRNLPSVAHSTTVPFPSLTMDFYFIYCLLPSCTLEREIVVTKIKYLKIACGGHPVVSLTEVCLTPHCRDLGPQDSKVLMSICLYCWSIAQKCPKPGLPIFNSAYLFKKKHWKIIWKLSC